MPLLETWQLQSWSLHLLSSYSGNHLPQCRHKSYIFGKPSPKIKHASRTQICEQVFDWVILKKSLEKLLLVYLLLAFSNMCSKSEIQICDLLTY
mmetsp:Transcript_35799/g.86419  ORF Transcript_35799/g.86419 Transcript_35799/m.86419 type:complete len:94 (+) Transcript_35799:4115-4396(+)